LHRVLSQSEFFAFRFVLSLSDTSHVFIWIQTHFDFHPSSHCSELAFHRDQVPACMVKLMVVGMALTQLIKFQWILLPNLAPHRLLYNLFISKVQFECYELILRLFLLQSENQSLCLSE
jgi:hypothetical protein